VDLSPEFVTASERQPSRLRDELRLSVVVCCHNSSARLAPTLRHIAAQSGIAGERWEVLVIDNASTDDTAARAQALWREFGAPTELRVVHEPRLGLTNAQRTGILAAKYEIVSLVDDDNWICPTWCATVLDLMERQPDITAIASRSEAAFDSGQVVPAWFPAPQHGYAVGPQAERAGPV